MAAATTVPRAAEAAEIHVGGETTWRVPPEPSFYSSWARTQNFTAGDVLVFKFVSGRHNVARVSKKAYHSCDTSNPVFVNSTTPFSLTLEKVDDDYYFICTFTAHCAHGQKLAITNLPAAAASPEPTIQN